MRFLAFLVVLAVFFSETHAQSRAIIVGAGAAGLEAAYRLEQKGYSVTILEGRGRVGGRLYTTSKVGAAVDEGAAWLFNVGPISDNPLWAVSQAQNWPLKLTLGPERIRDINGNHFPQSASTLLLGFAAFVNASLATDIDNTLGAYLDQYYATTSPSASDRLWMEFAMQSLFATSAGADFRAVSARYNLLTILGAYARVLEDNPAATDGGQAPYYYVTDGYGQRALAYLQGRLVSTKIVLSAPVASISQTASGLRATLVNGTTYDADYVVLTATLGNLKNGDIAFSPALPADYQNAINRMGWGPFEKIIATYPANAFAGASFSGIQDFRVLDPSTTPPFVISQSLNATDAANIPVPAFVGFVGGNTRGQYLLGLTDAQAGALLTQGLRGVLGGQFPSASNVAVTTWAKDPFSRGGYSWQAPFFQEDIATVSTPLWGSRLRFAGEHLSTVQQASVHGALQSGAFAVSDIPQAVAAATTTTAAPQGSTTAAATTTTAAATTAPPLPVNLNVIKDDCVFNVTQGNIYTYALSVTNLGPGTAVNVHLYDYLPPQLTIVYVTGPCFVEGLLVSCYWSSIAANDVGEASITYTVNSNAPLGYYANCASAVTDSTDSVTNNNYDCDTNYIVAPPTCGKYNDVCQQASDCCPPLQCLRHVQTCNSTFNGYRCASRGGFQQ